MKHLALLCCLIFPALLAAQACDYERLFREGKTFARQRQYKKALYKFNSARRCDPGKGETVDAAIEALLDQVEGEKKAADKALEDLRKTSEKVVESLLRDAENEVYHLRYAKALEILRAAADIGQKKTEVARALMEIAFFYAESGRFPEAQGITIVIARLLNVDTMAARIDTSDAPTARQTFRRALQALNPTHYAELKVRYYPVMIGVKGGEFRLGCETGGDCETFPLVKLPDFQLARTETTFWQFGLYAAATGQEIKAFSPEWGLDGDNPVVNVSWFKAVEYANWLSAQQGLQQAYSISSRQNDYFEETPSYYYKDSVVRFIPNTTGYCLPADEEWEYAARGGSRSDSFCYSELGKVVTIESVKDSLIVTEKDVLSPVAWFFDNSDTLGINRTRPVGTRMPNSLGFCDIRGNVWEWCWNVYDEYQEVAREDPNDPPTGAGCVVRGGSWSCDELNCRLVMRIRPTGGRGTYDNGVRLARH